LLTQSKATFWVWDTQIFDFAANPPAIKIQNPIDARKAHHRLERIGNNSPQGRARIFKPSGKGPHWNSSKVAEEKQCNPLRTPRH